VRQGHPRVALWADRAEKVDRLVAQVAHAARAHAALEPASADAAGLADPGLVLEPDLEALSLGMVAGDLGDPAPGSLFEARLRLGVGRRMHRAGLLSSRRMRFSA
jgi:hypothetical protein